jgi:hypothetical protein
MGVGYIPPSSRNEVENRMTGGLRPPFSPLVAVPVLQGGTIFMNGLFSLVNEPVV